jgi:PAS domain S-box-containing protein
MASKFFKSVFGSQEVTDKEQLANPVTTTQQTGADNPIFGNFLAEYKVLSEFGLNDQDLKYYFEEWCTYAVSIINEDSVQQFVNDKYCKLIGYSPAELIGQSGLKHFTKESKDQILSHIEVRKKGLSDSYEVHIIKQDGDVISARISGRPLINKAGKYIGSLAMIQDVTKEKELEEQLRNSNEVLEATVQKRTRELTIANYHMVNEIKERKLAEIALKNSEARFRDLFYSSPEGVFVEDFEGNILDINESAAKLHGYTRDELIGRNIKDFSPIADLNYLMSRQENLVIGHIDSFEANIEHRNGYQVPIAVKTAVIEYNDKPALLLHARDITDRIKFQETLKQMNVELEEKVVMRTTELQDLNATLQNEVSYRKNAEFEIEQQKDFLRLLIDVNPNLIFVKDQEGRFVLVNEAFARFYDVKPLDMIGKHQDDFSDKELSDVFLAQDQLVIDKQQTLNFDDLTLYNKGARRSAHLQMVKRPIKALNNQGTNVLGVVTDITAIKEAQDKLKQSEQLYRQIARNVPNSAIFIFDEDLRYVLAEGELVGVISQPKEEIEGKTIYDVTPPDILADRESRYLSILCGEHKQMQYEEKDRTLLVNALPIKDADGKVIYGMAITLDITDLKKAEKELEDKAANLKRSNEELERFAYVASHDLQGPLRTITSYLQLLEQRYFENLGADAKDFISFSVSGAKRMQQLITDLLNYSRINSAVRPYQQFNLSELVFVVTKNLEANIKAKDATVEYDNLPVMFAEQYQLNQMLQNLIDNGMKFVKDRKPIIKVTCTDIGTHWRLSVADNGIGIKDEFKDKIFNIFQRLHTDTEYTGTGIGLAICKKVADLHDGTIWFDSVYGEGTTFHVTISKTLKNKPQQ